MTHLGERVSALIDGELGHNDRERALAHLTFCADCRAEVEALRALKSRLRLMDPPAMPADLTMSLLRMPPPSPPDTRNLPGIYSLAPLDNRPRRSGGGSSGPGRGNRRVGYVAVGMASAAVALGTLFMVSGDPRPATPPEMMVPAPKTATPFNGQAPRATPQVSPSVTPSLAH
ncbi:anti-sigma factor family protein [Acrocarpospora catenulata]|uniref:anti-sigma factor family protein n=1 Tax=Acrocarpospora catenulata TaxID=2836182 RepID=UPI001BD96458|nr:zf-HC2 domain-containing protein [Acrocarpospora catenulata]